MNVITFERIGPTIVIASDGDVVERYNWQDADIAAARYLLLRAEARKQAEEYERGIQRAADFYRG